MSSTESPKLQPAPFLNLTSFKLNKTSPPLIEAALSKDYSQIEQLILQNASPFEQDNLNFNAIDYSVFLKQESTLPSFFGMNHETRFTPAKASKTSYYEIKKELERAKQLAAQSNLVSQNIYAGNLSVINHFFEISDYIFDYNPIQGLTAMHFAACAKSPAMVECLFEKGFAIDSKDDKGRTPLHYAALNKNKDLFSKLLELGSNPLEEDYLKVTPLDLLVVESKKKDPLKTSIHEQFNLFLLALQATYRIFDEFAIMPNNISEASRLTAHYLMPMTQLSLLLKGHSFSAKKILFGSACIFALRQFTITRLTLNAFVLSKLCVSSLFTLKSAFSQYSLRPKEAIKKIAATLLGPSLFGIYFKSSYSLDSLTSFFEDLSKIPEGSFFQTDLGEETIDEWDSLNLFFSTKFEELKHFFNI